MPGSVEIQRRLKSIKNTEKITKAMQMVSASKMKKAQNGALLSSNFLEEITLLKRKFISNSWNIDNDVDFDNKKNLIIALGTNKGLVGNFNVNLCKYISKKIGVNAHQVKFLSVGKKIPEQLRKYNWTIDTAFEKSDGVDTMPNVKILSSYIQQKYEMGEYEQIFIAYNKFVSTLKQEPVIVKLIPSPLDENEIKNDHVTIVEPNLERVLNNFKSIWITSAIYNCQLESDASEHASRMMLMQNATDSAGELIYELTLIFNKLRQNKITTELSEITSGKIALES